MGKRGKRLVALAAVAAIWFGSLFACSQGTEVEERSTLVLSESEISLEVGESYVLTAELKGTKAKTAFHWRSGDVAVATVNENGLVFAVAEGETTVTAQSAENTASCKIIVLNAEMRKKRAEVVQSI